MELSGVWAAYLDGDKRLAAFFAHRLGDWGAVVEARRQYPIAPLDSEAVSEIARANEGWKVSPRVVARAALLSSPETRVIAAGQQAGLLGGPLYTLYKAIAAVRWAGRLEKELGFPVVPIFWVASEDDDFDEVRTFRWPGSGKGGLPPDTDAWQITTYQVPGHRRGMPVYDIPVEPQFRSSLGGIQQAMRQTEFSPEIAEALDAMAAQSADFEGLFMRTMAWLLGDRAPLFISPRMEWVRRGAAGVLERELAQPGESSRRIIEAGERLAAEGFEAKLHRRPTHVNCFVMREGLRHRILVSEGGFEIVAPTGERETVAAERLRAELTGNPEHFSLNVVTRPMVQDSLLPTLAAIAGPGEVSYFAQLRGAYEFFGTLMPMLIPRPRVCLIEPRAERAFHKLGLEFGAGTVDEEELSRRLRGKLHDYLSPLEVEHRLLEATHQLNEAVVAVGQQVDLADPAVARAYDKLQEAVKVGLEKLIERQTHLAHTRDEGRLGAVMTALMALKVDGQPQERALTIFFPFLNLFGKRLIERLFGAIGLEERGLQLIVLSTLMAVKQG